MKVALITDTHAGVRNDSLAFHDYSKRFYDNVFFAYLDKHDIKTVVHCGDIVDRRKYININSAYRLRKDFIEPIIERNIDYHQIIGNHDTYFKNTNEVSSFIELFNRYPINIYSNATEVMLGDLKVLFLPWICDENKEHSFKMIRGTDAQICFGHLEIQGFEMYKGSIISYGYDQKLFSRFDLVASGHYHHRSSGGNIHYLGSHAEFTWSDYNDPRGFHVFDTETRQLEFIQNPYSMFKKIWYNDQRHDEIENMALSEYKDCIVKIIIQQKENHYWFEKFVERLEKENPLEIQIVEDHLNLGLEEEQHIIDEAESTIDIFKKYIGSVEMKGIDRSKLEDRITELYHEALTLD